MVSAILKVSAERSVELKYTAKRAIALEEELGCSMINGLAKLDRVSVQAKFIAHGAGISEEEACELLDELCESGRERSVVGDTIVKALENGGYIPKKVTETAKKLESQLTKSMTAPQS